MDLRFESLSKLSIEIAETRSFEDAFACLSLNLKYLMESYGFFFYYQRAENKQCYLGFPRNKQLLESSDETYLKLVETLFETGHPQLFSGEELQAPVFQDTAFLNPRILSILAYPLDLGEDGRALLVVSNKNTPHYYQFDFKFSRLIIHTVCNKLDQIHAQKHLLELIDEKENLVEELRYERDFSEKTIASLADGLILTDPDGKIFRVNKAIRQWTQKDQAALMGTNIRSLFSNPDQIPNDSKSIHSLQTNGSLRGVETTLFNSEGQETPVLFSCSALWDKAKQITGMVATVSDLTVFKQMQFEQRERATAEAVATAERERADELKKVNEELDRFVHVASHDLKAPLTSIMGLVEMSASPNISPEQQSAIMGMIKKSVGKLDHFIQDIVDYSRNARTEVKLSTVDLKEEAQSIIDGLVFMPQADKIDFQLEVEADTPFVSDATRIRVVLNNFLSNAVKYHDFSKPAPYVKFVAQVLPERAEITVHDNGKGIDQKHHEKLFQMFYRATSGQSGSGIGLYIVQEMAAKMEANISFNSTLGAGSSFTITIPNQHQQD